MTITCKQESKVVSFTQAITAASATWVVAHGLGTVTPVVDCWVDDGSGKIVNILPESVVATNNSTVTVTFSSPKTGRIFVA